MTAKKEGVLRIAELKDEFDFVQHAIRDEQSATRSQLVLEAICNIIVTKLGYQMAWIGLNDQSVLEVRQASEKRSDERPTPPTVTAREALRLDDGTRGVSTRTNKPARRYLSITNPSTRCNEDLNVGDESAISFPLKAGGVIIGTLGVYSDKENAFSPEEARILEILSETAALAIERADADVAVSDLCAMSNSSRSLLRNALDPGEVYFFRGSLEELLQLFKNHLTGGWSGLLICGRPTDKIMQVGHLTTVPTFQITRDASLANAIWSYTGLEILVSSFMRSTERPLAVIDRLEKLEEAPERGNLEAFIEHLCRQVKEVNGIAIIRMESIENTCPDVLQKYSRFL